MARVEFTDDAREDLRDLDGSSRSIVFKALLKLRDQPEQRGQPLGSRARGNLTGLRKLVIGNRDYRAVYQVTAAGDVAIVIVVAKRAESEVYELAIARMRLSTDLTIRALGEEMGRMHP